MSLRKIRGYDVCATSNGVGAGAGPDLLFDIVAGSWYNFSSALAAGKPGPPGSGPVGQAAFKWLGTGLFTDVFDPQASWYIGMDWQRAGAGSGPGTNKWLYLSTASAVVIGLESEASGKISIVAGGTSANGSGAVLATTSATFPIGSWPGYLEFTVSGFGLGGTLTYELWEDDVRLLTGTTSIADIPDRITRGSQGDGGRYFDNEYICDGQGAAPYNGRLGPVRVTALSPIGDASGNWNASPSGSKYLRVQDLPSDPSGSPDGDATYISPATITGQEFFNVATSPCYGRVLAVAANLCFRGTSGSAAVQALLLQSGSPVVIGVTPTVVGTYHTKQVLMTASPATGTYFTDAEISNGLWGVSTLTSLDARVTQIFLEKLVSLRNVPFSCGAGSYSY